MASIQQQGGEARFIRCDVSRSIEVEALVRGAVETFGRLDCAFNNAAVEEGAFAATADFDEATFDRVVIPETMVGR